VGFVLGVGAALAGIILFIAVKAAPTIYLFYSVFFVVFGV
jgi:hypothetical protein